MDARRLLNTLEELAEKANSTPGRGVTRFSWSPADRVARNIVTRELEALGLKISTDGIGNMHAIFPGSQGGKRVVVGSHLDTVRNGGRLDGTLGVVAALETLRSFHEEGFRPRRDIEFIAFAEEEGSNYGCTCLGSKAAVGAVGPEELKALRNAEGDCSSKLCKFGLNPGELSSQRLSPNEVHAFLELHIEQNARLEEAGRRIGVVTSICGMRLRRITLRGRSDHAASPMQGRRDPMAGFAEFASGMEALWKQGELPEDFSCTIGTVSCAPGVGIIIPECVTFTVDIRHVDLDTLEQGWKKIQDLLEHVAAGRGLESGVELLSASGGARMDEGIQEAIAQAARAHGVEAMRLPSGPAHDAAAFGAYGIPTGMIFVPSVKGLSHCPEEATEQDDLLLGAQILKEVVRHCANN